MSAQLFSKEIDGQYGPFWSEKAIDVEREAPELYSAIVNAVATGEKGFSDGPFWYKIKKSDQYGVQVIRTRSKFAKKRPDVNIDTLTAPAQTYGTQEEIGPKLKERLNEIDNGVQLCLAAIEQIKVKLGINDFETAGNTYNKPHLSAADNHGNEYSGTDSASGGPATTMSTMFVGDPDNAPEEEPLEDNRS